MGIRKRKTFLNQKSNSGSVSATQDTSGHSNFRLKSFFTLLIVLVAVFATHYYKYVYLPRTIATKSDLPQVGPDYDRKVWGTHRSHVYFGLKTQHPESPLFGMIWYRQKGIQLTLNDVRHWCEKDNGITHYAFTEADGRTFGRQTIRDSSLTLETDWINEGEAWTARVTTHSTVNNPIAVLFYLALQDPNSIFIPVYEKGKLVSLEGSSPVSDNFKLTFRSGLSPQSQSFAAINEVPFPDATKLVDTVFKNTIIDQNGLLRLTSSLTDQTEKSFNLILLQFNIFSNSTLELSYSSDAYIALQGRDFEKALKDRVSKFSRHFEDVYMLKAKGLSLLHQSMGRVALSNMLGSIGYYHGYNRVQSQQNSEKLLYGPQELLSACPCRSTFPRGFLWDEGFHHLLFRKFDPALSLKIISSWLDTMNIDGWIPREMILGAEAELRVPPEFIVQMDKTANPPMFFFLIQRFLDDKEFITVHASTLIKMYPRLALWYTWLNRTQAGPLPGTYRWRGRNATIDTELNPKTLASGFDDYPRATHPSEEEYHLDLRCWMALSAKVLSRLAKISGDSEGETIYKNDAVYLSDLNHLNKLHWCKTKQRFCDYGFHSPAVTLRDVPLRTKSGQVLRYQNGEIATVRLRSVEKPPKHGFVRDSFGYISLFPVMLRLLPHDSLQLRTILENLRSEKELWSKYGLRSLSKSSPYYKARNTKDDPPYWRGNVWINMNYMMLSALKYYSQITGPYRNLASTIYNELRNNIVENLAREFKRTGVLWEHYDDESGKGGGAYPFTGWSALVLSIMAEQYD